MQPMRSPFGNDLETWLLEALEEWMGRQRVNYAISQCYALQE
jgi:hypothetical protein